MSLSRILAVAAAAAAAVLATAPSALAYESGSPTLRIVVSFRAAASDAQIRAVERQRGLTEHFTLAALRSRVVTGRGSASSVLASLRADSSVAYAELDGLAQPTDVTPNDPYFPTGAGALNGGEWGSFQTQAPAAWGVTTGSNNVIVAIIDSGVVASQPDLSPVLIPGWNVLTGTADAADTFGHGTEVAGVAVAASNNAQGVAAYCWSCRLMPVKVYNSSSAYLSDIANGMVWAVDHGAKVLNISMAGTSSSSVLANAVSYANAHGAVVVAAAGNNGNSTPTYPAAIPGVISVAGSDQTDALYSYSDYGSWVDVAAPGANVTTLPNGGYGAVGGTSLASPVVAGIAGLMLSAQPAATPAQVADALFSSTAPTAGTHDTQYGRVNAYRALMALNGAGTGTTPPPTLTTAPTISGTAQSGATLSAGTGAWSNSPSSYAYQWRRCDGAGASCAPVTGATSATYPLTGADVGATMRVTVTATNSGGSASADSQATPVVSTGFTTHTVTGSLTKSKTSSAFTFSSGSGAATASLSFSSSCSSLTLAVKSAAGSLLATGTGPSVLSLSATLTGGSYSWTVSGSCRVSFTLTVSAPA